MIDITRDLPEWARNRGHPIPRHIYKIDEDSGMLYMTCPEAPQSFRLWYQSCPCEPKPVRPKP